MPPHCGFHAYVHTITNDIFYIELHVEDTCNKWRLLDHPIPIYETALSPRYTRCLGMWYVRFNFAHRLIDWIFEVQPNGELILIYKRPGILNYTKNSQGFINNLDQPTVGLFNPLLLREVSLIQ